MKGTTRWTYAGTQLQPDDDTTELEEWSGRNDGNEHTEVDNRPEQCADPSVRC